MRFLALTGGPFCPMPYGCPVSPPIQQSWGDRSA
jgi:hypothetical protein